MHLLCTIGLHDYSWEYISPDSCDQIGHCCRPNCTKTKQRLHHLYKDWEYISATDCHQQRICRRNAEHIEHKHKPAHIWGRALYIHEGDCERIAICERNPEHTRSSIDHIWGPPVRGAHCVMTKHCQRCPNGIAFVGVQHDFHATEWVNGHRIRRCRYCSHCETLGR